MTPTSRSRTFVLVHGSWHGGWCWRRVADRLRAGGHRVYAPTLTGLADRSHLLSRDVTLDTHVADIVNLFRWEEIAEATLVGHSFGGFAVSGALEQVVSRVSALVYLDAFVAQDGESPLDAQAPEPRRAIEAALAAGQVGRPPPPAALFKVADPADEAWIDAQMTPQPLGPYATRLRLTGARERVTTTYIRATRFPQARFDAYLANAQANPRWRAVALDCGHEVMVDEPDRLAELLIAAGDVAQR